MKAHGALTLICNTNAVQLGEGSLTVILPPALCFSIFTIIEEKIEKGVMPGR